MVIQSHYLKTRQKTVITKLLQSVSEAHYKVRQVLQNVTEFYYKVCQVLGITRCFRETHCRSFES